VKEVQTITFPAITGTQTVGDTVGLTATASSGLAVTFTSLNPYHCTVGSGTLQANGSTAATASLNGPGICQIKATQAGNATYAAAPAVASSFTVSPHP
jgi:hypothetical protein